MDDISKIKNEMNKNLFLFSTLGFIFTTSIIMIHKNYPIETITKSELFLTANIFLITSIIIINKILSKTKNQIKSIIRIDEKEDSHHIVLKIREVDTESAKILEKKFITLSNYQSFFFGFYLSWLPSLFIYFLK